MSSSDGAPPEFEDEDGIIALLPVDHGLRKIQPEGFSTGPDQRRAPPSLR